MTATELKKRAIALAEKTKIDSVTPEEVGHLSNDIVEYIEDVEINGSSLGIRQTYTSVSAMEADSTAPKDDKGVLLRRGMLVNIYNQSEPDSADNGKVFSFQNPGWAFRGTVDAGYATKDELEEVEDYAKKATAEYNVSVFHPTFGTSGTNRYDLAGAIGQVPAELRTDGVTVSFLNESGDTEKWEFGGGSWEVSNFSQVGAEELTEIYKKSAKLSSKTTEYSPTEIVSTSTHSTRVFRFSEFKGLTKIKLAVPMGKEGGKLKIYSAPINVQSNTLEGGLGGTLLAELDVDSNIFSHEFEERISCNENECIFLRYNNAGFGICYKEDESLGKSFFIGNAYGTYDEIQGEAMVELQDKYIANDLEVQEVNKRLDTINSKLEDINKNFDKKQIDKYYDEDIIIHGDSYSQGAGDATAENTTFFEKLKKLHPHANITNKAVGGASLPISNSNSMGARLYDDLNIPLDTIISYSDDFTKEDVSYTNAERIILEDITEFDQITARINHSDSGGYCLMKVYSYNKESKLFSQIKTIKLIENSRGGLFIGRFCFAERIKANEGECIALGFWDNTKVESIAYDSSLEGTFTMESGIINGKPLIEVSIFSKTRILLIETFMNDGKSHIGTISDNYDFSTFDEESTIIGSLERIFYMKYSKNPSVRIGMIFIANSSDGSTYRESIIPVLKKWGIPYLDQQSYYHEYLSKAPSELKPWFARYADWSVNYHPSAIGYWNIENEIFSFLEKL